MKILNQSITDQIKINLRLANYLLNQIIRFKEKIMEKNRQYVGSNKNNVKSFEPKEVKGLSDAMNYQQWPSSNFKKTDAKVSITEQSRQMLKPRRSVDLSMLSQKSLHLPYNFQNDPEAKIDRYPNKYFLNSSRSKAVYPDSLQTSRTADECSMSAKYQGMKKKNTGYLVKNNPEEFYIQSLNFKKQTKVQQNPYDSIKSERMISSRRNTVTEANAETKQPAKKKISYEELEKEKSQIQVFYLQNQVRIAECLKTIQKLKEGSKNKDSEISQLKMELKNQKIKFQQSEQVYIAECQKRVKQLKKGSEKKDSEISQLKMERNEHKRMYESSQFCIAECQKRVKQLKKESEKKDSEISQLKMELRKQKVEFEQSQSQKQIRLLKESIKTLEKQNEDLEMTKAVDIEYYERPLKLKISELEKIIKDKQNQISSLTSAVKRNEEGFDLARGKNCQLKQKVQKLETQIILLEKRVSGHEAKLIEANKKQGRLNQQIQLLKAEAERKKKPVKLEDLDQESRKKITKEMDERSSLQLRYIDQMEGENQKLELQISALKKELNQLRPTKK